MMDANKENHIDLTGGEPIKLTIDWDAFERDPQARQRVRNLFEISLSILKRENLLGKGLTYEQVKEELKARHGSQPNSDLG